MRNAKMMMVALALVASACGNNATNNGGSGTNNGVDPNNGDNNSTNNGTVAANNGDNNGTIVDPNNGTIVDPNNGTIVDPNNGVTPEPSIVAEFNGAFWQLPESLAYHDGLAYLSFLNGSVVTVDADGTVSEFGSVAIEPQGSAYALGIAVGDDGTVFVAMTVASADSTFPAGIYSIPAAGGQGTLLASHPELWIPNDVDTDGAGNLYITADGTIFKASATTPGEAEIWKRDALLGSSDGTADAPCGVRTSPFPIGANGIEVEDDRVVVGNTEAGAILEIAVNADGSAGAIQPLVTDTAELCGIDGLVGDSDGSFLATVRGTRVSRISADGSTVELVYEGLPLRSPAGIDVGMFGGSHQAIIANPDFHAAFGPDGPPSAQPNLTALPLL